MKAKHNAHGMHFCLFMDPCISLPLWIILNSFIPPHLCLHICALHRGIRLQTRPSALTFSPCFDSCKTEMLTLICFAEGKAACLGFRIFPCNPFASPSWPAGIYYKLQLHVLPFVIHQSRQPYWNIAVVLPAAWMRLTGTFLGLQ